jgi:hypothetical protein
LLYWLSLLDRNADAIGLGLGVGPWRNSTTTDSSRDPEGHLRVNGQQMLPPISPVSPLDLPPLDDQVPTPVQEYAMDTQSESDVRSSKRDSTLGRLKGFFSSSHNSKDRPPSLRKEASVETLPNIRGPNRLSLKSTSRAKPLEPKLSHLSTHFEDGMEGPSMTQPESPKSEAIRSYDEASYPSYPIHQIEDWHLTEASPPGSEIVFSDPQSERVSYTREELDNAHPYMRADHNMPQPESPIPQLEDQMPTHASRPTSYEIPQESPKEPPKEPPKESPVDVLKETPMDKPKRASVQSTEASSIRSSPPNGSKRTSRIRYSSMIPEMSAPPPNGPLPPPPNSAPPHSYDMEESRRDSLASYKSAKYAKRISTSSFASNHSGRNAGGQQRLSALFTKNLGHSQVHQLPSSNRVSMPPPAKPPPTVALPPLPPRPGSADPVLTIPLPTRTPPPTLPKRNPKRMKRESSASSEAPSNLPPISLPPVGPLPPIPQSAPNSAPPDLPADRTMDRKSQRLSRSPFAISQTAMPAPRVLNPFGQSLMNWSEEESMPATPDQTRDNFLEVNTPTSQLSPRQSTSEDFATPFPMNDLDDHNVIPINISKRPDSTFYSPTMMVSLTPVESTPLSGSIRSSASVL